jgi:hypothetical protein
MGTPRNEASNNQVNIGQTTLSKEEWGELYSALLMKRHALATGQLGEEIEDGEDARWLAELDALMVKMGPDGCNMWAKGTGGRDEGI